MAGPGNDPPPPGAFPPPPPPGGLPPPPAGWWPAPPPRRRTGLRNAVIGVTVGLGLLGIAVTVFAVYLQSRPLHTPPALAGRPRATGAAAADVERELRAEMGDVPKLITAAYGTGDPEYVLIAGDGGERDTEEAFDEFAKGFTEDDGGTVGPSQVQPGGVKCATLTMEGLRGAFCAWGGGRSDGFVVAFDSRNLRRLAEATVAARAAVQG